MVIDHNARKRTRTKCSHEHQSLDAVLEGSAEGYPADFLVLSHVCPGLEDRNDVLKPTATLWPAG